MSEIVNAKITGTMLGIEDHDIFTCMVYLEWDGAGIGFGGYALDQHKDGKPQGFAPSVLFLRKLLEIVGVEKWEDLRGKYVRLEIEGWGGKALGIGHIIEDEWLYPKKFFEENKIEA